MPHPFLRTLVALTLALAPFASVRGQTGHAGDTARIRHEVQAGDTLQAPPPAVDPARLHLGSDSITAAPGETYPASSVHRFFFGDLNRDLWAIPIRVPVLDLDSVGGGLTLDELSGGKQTLGLRLEGEDGVTYQFRSIVKTPWRAIPTPLRATPAEDVFNDQMAAQFPLSAMVVAELLTAADILVARPRPVIMPDDPRLGEYREAFAGRMGWIEVRPNEGEDDTPGFAGSSKITGTDELYEELREEPLSYVDGRRLVRARLIDMLVGDWDRHSDQWRWASFEEEDGRTRWEPIPRDRDWALSRIDGFFPSLTSVYFPRYVGFEHEYHDVMKMAWSGQRVDRTLLTELEREDFLTAARELQRTFSDSVLADAVGVLPPAYRAAVEGDLLPALRNRRDGLLELAGDYYELLAGWVDVFGTEEVDSVVVTSPDPGTMRVQAFAPEHAVVRYDRTFREDETREVRIYLRDGDDRLVIDSPRTLPISLRVVGGEGDDRYEDSTDGDHVVLYDDEGDNTIDLGHEAFETDDQLLVQDSLRLAYAVWHSRDWGTAWVPRPEARWDSDIGLFVGAGLARYGFGFGFRPYRSHFSASVLNGFRADQWIVDLELERPLGPTGWRGVAGVDAFTHEPTWLFGFGNDVPAVDDENAYRSYRSSVAASLGLRFVADTTWSASTGVRVNRSGSVDGGGLLFEESVPYGADDFTDLEIHAGVRFDTRDGSSLPTRGLAGEFRTRLHPATMDVEETFGGVRGELVTVASATPFVFEPALHLRVVGERIWGAAPYHRAPTLGGSASLPGFVKERFRGHSLLSGAALLRLKLLDLRMVSDLGLGVHGLATSGRVWSGLPESDTWHTGYGGGLWLHLPGMDRTVSVTAVDGDSGLRAYLDFGFIF